MKHWTVKEIAKASGFTPEYIRQLLGRGELLTGYKAGWVWRVADDEVRRFLDGVAARRVAATRPNFAARVHALAACGATATAIAQEVYGYKSGFVYAKIKEVLDGD